MVEARHRQSMRRGEERRDTQVLGRRCCRHRRRLHSPVFFLPVPFRWKEICSNTLSLFLLHPSLPLGDTLTAGGNVPAKGGRPDLSLKSYKVCPDQTFDDDTTTEGGEEKVEEKKKPPPKRL